MSKKLYDYSRTGKLVGSTTAIVNGVTDGIINTNNMTHPYMYKIWKTMLNCTWFPEEADLTEDVAQYKKLLPNEKSAYDKALAQLIFMDSIQTNNSSDNVNPFITSPETNACIIRQAFEEALHSVSYAVMVESISENTDEIYDLHKTDTKLREKNEHIGNTYENLAPIANQSDEDIKREVTEWMQGDSSNAEEFQKVYNIRVKERLEAQVLMIVANQALEGIYFLSGFLVFYLISRMGKMNGSATMIKFINRDENNHLALYSTIFKNIVKENPGVLTPDLMVRIKEMLTTATELEVDWGQYITNNQILGITNDHIEGYVKFLANDRFDALGLSKEYGNLYPEFTNNPIKWVDKFSQINDTKTDLFSGDNQSYTLGAVSFTDDDI